MLERYIRTIKIGDWFVLYQMSKNLNRRFFYDFLLELAKEYEANPDVIEEGPDHFIKVDEPDDDGTEKPTSPDQGTFWLTLQNLQKNALQNIMLLNWLEDK